MEATAGLRARWAAIGAAIAVSLGGGGLAIVRATTSEGVRSVYIPITPCRLFDTRPSPYLVGGRSTPIGAADTATFQVTGSIGQCTIPADATAVAMNLTAVGATANGFVTVYPADAARPTTASVNFLAGEVRQNQVQAKLSAAGAISVYNYAGATDVIADVNGYYVDHVHDDRYYTKAEVDAMHAPTSRTISITADGLNLLTVGSAVVRDTIGRGLDWANNVTGAATWTMPRPADATGAGNITLTVWFYRTTNAAGNVRFKTVPQDWEVGGSVDDDAAPVTGTTQSAGGSLTLRTATISWPASGEAGAFWNIVLQRDTSVGAAYPDHIFVRGCSLTYEATR